MNGPSFSKDFQSLISAYGQDVSKKAREFGGHQSGGHGAMRYLA